MWGEVADPLRGADLTSLRNSSHEVTQLLPCETAKTGPPPLLLFRGVGTTAFCVPGCGRDPPHQGWSVRQEVPALHLSRLNRQLDVTEGKLCQCPRKAGVSNMPGHGQGAANALRVAILGWS